MRLLCREHGTDEGITVTVEDEGKQEVRVLHPTSKEKVIFFLVNVPYGVQKMSGTIKGLVETSTNIGILKTSENEVMGSSSIRSSVETARDSLSDKIAYLTEFLGETGRLSCVGVSQGFTAS